MNFFTLKRMASIMAMLLCAFFVSTGMSSCGDDDDTVDPTVYLSQVWKYTVNLGYNSKQIVLDLRDSKLTLYSRFNESDPWTLEIGPSAYQVTFNEDGTSGTVTFDDLDRKNYFKDLTATSVKFGSEFPGTGQIMWVDAVTTDPITDYVVPTP